MRNETTLDALNEHRTHVNKSKLESYSPFLEILPSLAGTIFNSFTSPVPAMEYGGRGYLEKNEIVHSPEGTYDLITSGSHAKNTDGMEAIGLGVLSDKVKYDKKTSFKQKFEKENKEAIEMSKKLSKQKYKDPITKASLERTSKAKTQKSFKELLDQQEIVKKENNLENKGKEYKYGMKTYEFGGRGEFNKWLYNVYAKENPDWDSLSQDNVNYDPYDDPKLKLAFSEYRDTIASDPELGLSPMWMGEKTGIAPSPRSTAGSPDIPALATPPILPGESTTPEAGGGNGLYQRIASNNILGGIGQAMTYASNKRHALAQAAEDLPEVNYFEGVSERAEDTLEANAARISGLADIQRSRNNLNYLSGVNSIQNRGYQTNASNRLSLFQALNRANQDTLQTEIGSLSQNANILSQTQLRGDVQEAMGATEVLANTQADIAANRDAMRQADNLLGTLTQNFAGISNSNLADMIRLNMFQYLTDGGSGVGDLINNG